MYKTALQFPSREEFISCGKNFFLKRCKILPLSNVLYIDRERRGNMQETDKHSRLKADIEEYSDMVLRIAVQNARNFYDAQDITQEVFMRLMDNYDSAHGAHNAPSAHKKAWLIRVTLNLCRDAARRRRYRDLGEPNDNLCFAESGFENYELMDMIRRLPEHQRNALYLHVFEGFSIDEIAELTGRNPRTVGSDIHRAKKRLRLEYEE